MPRGSTMESQVRWVGFPAGDAAKAEARQRVVASPINARPVRRIRLRTPVGAALPRLRRFEEVMCIRLKLSSWGGSNVNRKVLYLSNLAIGPVIAGAGAQPRMISCPRADRESGHNFPIWNC